MTTEHLLAFIIGQLFVISIQLGYLRYHLTK